MLVPSGGKQARLSCVCLPPYGACPSLLLQVKKSRVAKMFVLFNEYEFPLDENLPERYNYANSTSKMQKRRLLFHY